MIVSRKHKPKSFINNPFFRIISPIVLSIIIYFLVLMAFDTLDQLDINFFRAELILCLLISYLVSEFNRLLIIILNKSLTETVNLSKKIIIQISLSTLLTLIITSLAVGFYMQKLVGFQSYSSELIVFNSFYIPLSWCYHAIYFSMIYLKKVASIKLENEKLRKEAVEIQMENSLRFLKPAFLNNSLESLIVLGYKDSELADKYLEKISDFYRELLDSLQKKFALLKEELNNALNFVDITNQWKGNIIQVKNNIKSKTENHETLSGSLLIIFEYLLNKSILLPQVLFEINLSVKNEVLELSCSKIDSLQHNEDIDNELNELKSSYQFHTQKTLEIIDTDESFTAKIPLVQVDLN